MRVLMYLIMVWFVSQVFFVDARSRSMAIDIGVRLSPDRFLFLILCGWFGWMFLQGRGIRLRLGRLEWTLLAFMCYCTVSMVLGGANAHLDPDHGRNKWLNALFNVTFFPYFIFMVMKYVPYRRDLVRIFFWGLIGLGAYLGITGVMEHFKMEFLVWPRYIMDYSIGHHAGRTRGPFLNSVTMGRALIISFLAMQLVATWRGPFTKTVLYSLMAVIMAAIYFTYTRGPWLGFAAALGTMIYFKSALRKPTFIFMGLIFLAGIAGFANKFSFSEGTLFSKRQNTVTDRMVSYQVTYWIFEENPLFGIGFGKLNEVWPEYFEKRGNEIGNIEFGGFDGSHNTYLTAAAELGIVGVALYAWIQFQLVLMAWNVYHRVKGYLAFETAWTVMVIAAGAMYLLTGLVSDLRWNLYQNSVMYALLGMVAGLGRAVQGEEWKEELKAELKGQVKSAEQGYGRGDAAWA